MKSITLFFFLIIFLLTFVLFFFLFKFFYSEPIITIIGPTAIGKTSISIKLAEMINGEIGQTILKII